MKPILYPPEERDFDNNGLGILSDAISCVVTWKANGIYDLTMEYPMDGIHFDKITDRCIIMAIPTPYKKAQPFRIAKITTLMDGTATIYAKHVAYDLEGFPLLPFSASSAAAAMAGLLTNAAVAPGFTFWTDKTTVASFNVPLPTSIWSVLGGSEGSILDVYGGQYDFDIWAVKLYNQLGQDNGVVIRYGKNLVDLDQERNLAKMYTGVFPYWADSNGENMVVCDPKIVPVEGNFNYTNILTLDLSGEWQDPPTPEQLKTRTERYIKDNKLGEPTVSITVSHEMLEQTDEYAGLSMLERCSVFDTVSVQFEKLGVDAKATIVSAETDVLLERYNKLDIGSVRANIVDTVLDQEQQIQKKPDTNTVQQAIKNTADKIIGAKGGSKLDIFDGEKTVGTMYLDTDSVDTAKNIIIINNEGIAFSNAGINGPWTTAIGIDGTLATQWIQTWRLDAAVVHTGILQSRDGKTFFLDLDAGVLKMQATELTIAGKTVDEIAQEKADGVSQDLADFVDTVTADIDNLQSQIDGQIQTWFYDYEPTAENAPANGWTSTEDKNKHLGDLFYIVDNPTSGGRVYRWALVSGEYKWIIVEDEDTAKALAAAAAAQDTADGKRRVFVSQPVPPYDVGDLWAQGSGGDLMRCNVARASGNYVAADWGKASKYIDSAEAGSIAADAVDAQTQLDIFNKLTNNGALQGLYMEDGKLYINCEYLGAQTITSANGVLSINLATGILNISMGKNALKISTNGMTYSNPDGHLGSSYVGSSGLSVSNFSQYVLHYPEATEVGQEGEVFLYWNVTDTGRRKLLRVDDILAESISVSSGSNLAYLKTDGPMKLRSDNYGVQIGKYGTNLNGAYWDNIVTQDGQVKRVLVDLG